MIPLLLLLATITALAAPRGRFGFALLMLAVFATVAGNIENPDRIFYVDNFQGIRSGGENPSFEPGYQLLVSWASFLGLDYGAFHFVMTAGALVLIGKTILDLCDLPGLAAFAYLCFPFIWDVTQVRNFYAMALILFSMRYLLVEQRASPAKYALTILLAAMFHITSAFYLLFLLARIRNRFVLWAILALGAGAYFTLFSELVTSPLLAFIGDKIDVYTTTETSMVTKLSVGTFYAASLVMIWWAGRRIAGRGTAARGPAVMGTWAISAPLILNMNLIAGLSILPALDNLDFIRLFRNIFLINCIFVINAIRSRRSGRMTLTLSFLLYLVATFTGLVALTSTSDIIGEAMQNNAIND
jgi:hypothetical protein